MQGSIPHADLKAKQRSIRDNFPSTMGLRVHRAISWIERSEMCDDPDGQFLFLWIAFNAAYAKEADFQEIPTGERTTFNEFFQRLVSLDKDNRIYDAIWSAFSGPIRMLMQNKHVFNPFWLNQNDIPNNEDWEDRFVSSARVFTQAVQARDTVRLLGLVFDRLYVLRNQLVHGGATWNGRVNRDQVGDGAAILAFLMPVIVDIMMDNPNEVWGQPFYLVVE